MHGDGDSSDIEFMLPPPLNGRASSNAPLPKRPAAISSSQPVFIEIDDSDDDDGDGARPGSGMEDTPPRLAVPQPRAALHKTVSAPAVFPATTGASASYRNATTSRHGGSNTREEGDESDDLPDIGMAAIANKRDKGKGRAVETAVALTDTEEEKSSSDEEPAKKKRKAQGTGKRTGGSGSDKSGLSKAEQKKLDAAEKKKAKDQEKKEKAIALAAEKESKKSLNASNKLIDRKAAASEVIVDFSEALMQEGSPFFEQIYTKLTANLKEIDCVYSERQAPPAPCFPKIVNWKRKVTKDWDAAKRYWRPRKAGEDTVEEEPTILLYLSVNDIERAVEAGKQNRSGSGEGTLVDLVGKARAAHAPDYQVFLLIQNLNDKAKAKKSSDNANWQAEARGGAAAANAKKKKGKYNQDISMEDIEMELCRVMLAERCFIIRPDKWDEAVDWLVELTKDIGYRPYKRIERAREAYLNIDGRIESSDRGNLTKTYINQLACINGITEPMATAIVSFYSTWRRLLEAYKQCGSTKEKQLMLEGVPIGSNINGAATNRTIGKVASERVYIVLFSMDSRLDLSGNIKDVRARMAT